jgi:diguanylate cyclase (GGDEF)-like protein
VFAEHLDRAIARTDREGGQLGVMFLDLDRFKHVNDSLGHAAGDELLRQAAARLARAVRPTDVLSRLGGDEFAVLLQGVMPRDAVIVARRILRRFERPFALEDREIQTTTSIGIAHGKGEHQTARDLLRHADAALYLAKGEGRGRFEVFDEPMRAWLHDRLEIETELREGVAAGQIVVHYQPLLNLVTGRIESVEALVRWQHPTRGILTAADFIGVAEESGLIVPIGLQVIRAAAEQLTRWHHELGDAAPSIAVNLSARELAVPVDPLLEAAQDKMSWMGIELSETTLMADAEREAGHRRELERHGARIIVDDFGMGYSSLARLSRMRVDMIKIAKEFVDGVCTMERDRATVDAIIRLAHAFGISVVAEAVETPEQLEALRELGCDVVQGNLIAPACPAAELVLTPR